MGSSSCVPAASLEPFSVCIHSAMMCTVNPEIKTLPSLLLVYVCTSPMILPLILEACTSIYTVEPLNLDIFLDQ